MATFSSSSKTIRLLAAALMLVLLLAIAGPQLVAAQCNAQTLLASCGSSSGIPAHPKSGCCPALKSAGLSCVCGLLSRANVQQSTVQNYIKECQFGSVRC